MNSQGGIAEILDFRVVEASWSGNINAAYIKIAPDKECFETIEFEGNTVLVDHDKNGLIIGIEVLLGSRKKAKKTIWQRIKDMFKW